MAATSSTDWHQFVHARSGIVRLHTDAGAWTLPPERGLWVGAGVAHTATIVRRASMRTLYFPADRPLLDDDVAVVEMTPLVRALVLRLADDAPVPLDETGDAWWRVLSGEVRRLDRSPLRLPALTSDTAAAVAAQILDEPGSQVSLGDLAASVGASRRMIERQFRTEAGMSAGTWRTRARLLHSLELLADGAPVGRVAVAVGYATQSAFGAMFKRHLRVAPGSYFSSDNTSRT